ncbi:MAG: hypothetical protein HLUCCA11_19685 [Phormidesmis priestleyi Ana]|uniref:Uncharacterized protein n=1 Tax=Phormidesmis priestleyi Ana TaxID=1666911 RepID=A0A0N8KM89_9CYAN|nr:MAG: hypothetical protein HLUCCA11_19685 [Phormidesmis priestleyi Ana]
MGLSVLTNWFKFHYPARGRKPGARSLRGASVPVQIPLPRKGTETHPKYRVERLHDWFKFHYPARGRKLGYWPFQAFFHRFKFHYPARGRKRSPLEPITQKQLVSSNSITPQGDGNLRQDFCQKTEPPVQIPLPRKGTETSLLYVHLLQSLWFKFHYPARGRKQ